MGRKTDAQFQWNHARDLNPDQDDLPKILGKIEKGLPDASAAPPSDHAASPAAAHNVTGNGE